MWHQEDWQNLFTNTEGWPYPFWQDARHIYLQYILARAGYFANILEVGSYRGASTSAYVQALLDGAAFNLTCCDIKITNDLRDTVAKAPSPVILAEMPSVRVIGPQYDLVIIDGDHGLEAVSREIGLCLAHQTKTIILHDTFADYIPGCEGSVYAGRILEMNKLYKVVVDAVPREGEFTDRGLSIATKDYRVYEHAKNVVSYW